MQIKKDPTTKSLKSKKIIEYYIIKYILTYNKTILLGQFLVNFLLFGSRSHLAKLLAGTDFKNYFVQIESIYLQINKDSIIFFFSLLA